jgi:hypothetical protein
VAGKIAANNAKGGKFRVSNGNPEIRFGENSGARTLVSTL